MNTPQQNNGATAPDPAESPSSQNPSAPPQEPPFIPYQKSSSTSQSYSDQPGNYPPYSKPKTKMATASLVLGAISLGLTLIGFLGDFSDLEEAYIYLILRGGYQNVRL